MMHSHIVLFVLLVLLVVITFAIVRTIVDPLCTTGTPTHDVAGSQRTDVPEKDAGPHGTGHQGHGVCNVRSCGAIDPVSDPKYNMTEIIKQSILVEEHLTLEHKRCKDCIAKHLLIMLAYAEESVMLACGDVDEYPLLLESVAFYKNMFQRWSGAQDDANNLRDVAGKLREWRKLLMQEYVIER